MSNEQTQTSENCSARNILESSIALRWLLKCCGLACFSVQPYRRVSNVTFVDALLFVLNIVILPVLFGIKQRAIGPLASINKIGLNLLFRFSYFVLWVNLLTGFIIRHRIAAILIGMYQTDDLLRNCGVIVPHARHSRVMFGFVVGLCIALVVMPLSLAAYSYVMYDMQLWSVISSTLHNVYSALCCAAVTAVYGFSLLALQQRFFSINHAISSIWSDSPSDISDIDQSTERPLERGHTIRQLRKIFARLTELADECNVCFAVPVMALSAATFGYLLFFMFIVYKIIANDNATDQLHMMWLSMWWNAFYVTLLLMIVHVGSRLSQTGRHTGACVHATINELCWTSDRAVIQELLQFSDQVLDSAPVASCGLFMFDWSLVYSVRDSLLVEYHEYISNSLF